MKIAIYSPNFHPMTGGLENAVIDLATEFERQGNSVTIITLTPATDPDSFPFHTLRNPSFLTQVRTMRCADMVLQFNVSLKGILPWLFARKPLVVSHQTPYRKDLRGRLKTWISNNIASLNIGCSAYISGMFSRAVTVPNPYNHSVFVNNTSWEMRDRQLVFVGRLVSDKGGGLLLEALSLLKESGLEPSLTIIGDGTEMPELQGLAVRYRLETQVVFSGIKKGVDLANEINRHRIMVVPSIWNEPFGIVALEGLACGCLVVCSNGGGLPEAVGTHGLLFPNSDVRALAGCLNDALQHPKRYLPNPEELTAHLERHRRSEIAAVYLHLFEEITCKRN